MKKLDKSERSLKVATQTSLEDILTDISEIIYDMKIQMSFIKDSLSIITEIYQCDYYCGPAGSKKVVAHSKCPFEKHINRNLQ